MDTYDCVIIGSGFGGSVSALRMIEKGYTVLVLEKGRRFGRNDFPTSNWDVRRSLWFPIIGCYGPLKVTVFRHVTVFSGVGVGGGSLVYASTHPVPGDKFFQSGVWAGLADWKSELMPHYETVKKMIGSNRNPKMWPGDKIFQEIAEEDGRGKYFELPEVAIYFGEEGKEGQEVPDPFFEGKGPSRAGCTHCGGCMIGCRVGAKNTLDQNYLYLAERRGAEVRPEVEVTAVRPLPDGTYVVEGRGLKTSVIARRVIFSGGVLGTVDLLLKLQQDPKGLPNLSKALGENVLTNSESLIKCVVPGVGIGDMSKGIAITSKYKVDEDSAVEPCRYPKGSGFWRFSVLPHAPGRFFVTRLARTIWALACAPLAHLRGMFVNDWASSSQVLLFMRTAPGALTIRRSRLFGMRSFCTGQAPEAFMADATRFARRFAAKAKGVITSLWTELFLGTPSTAHILGGACIHTDPKFGVVGLDNQIHGYPGLYICDGSTVSANVGVNPSLTIMAMTERAMQKIPLKKQ